MIKIVKYNLYEGTYKKNKLGRYVSVYKFTSLERSLPIAKSRKRLSKRQFNKAMKKYEKTNTYIIISLTDNEHCIRHKGEKLDLSKIMNSSIKNPFFIQAYNEQVQRDNSYTAIYTNIKYYIQHNNIEECSRYFLIIYLNSLFSKIKLLDKQSCCYPTYLQNHKVCQERNKALRETNKVLCSELYEEFMKLFKGLEIERDVQSLDNILRSYYTELYESANKMF